MKLLRALDDRKNQRAWGVAFLLAVASLAAAPILLEHLPLPQIEELESVYVRRNNHIFPKLLNSIKRRNGALLIGTSETVAYIPNDDNYWQMLNRDAHLRTKLTTFGGAGRTPITWVPAILANQDAFRQLKVILYINPTYLRPSLNVFNAGYFIRYNDLQTIESLLPEYRRYGLEPLIDPFLAELRLYESQAALGNHVSESASRDVVLGEDSDVARVDSSIWIEDVFERFRTYFVLDLRLLWKARWKKVHPQPRPFYATARDYAEHLQEGIDPSFNASHRFIGKATGMDVPPVDMQSNHYIETLSHFIRLANEIQINLVVVLGPFNGLLAQRMNANVIPGYERKLAMIRSLIEGAKVPLIDATDLSFVPGTFMDTQHQSAYGAFLIAHKMTEYFKKVEAQ